MDTKSLLAFAVVSAAAIPVMANEPITPRGSWEGRVDFFMTGTALAVDTTGDFRVDASSQPAAIVVQPTDVVGDLEAAWIYWGGSQAQPAAGACTSGSDDTIQLTLPNGGVAPVTADDCYCSDGGSINYDVWVCRADVSAELIADGGKMDGTYMVSDYEGLWANGSTHNASTSLLLVYGDPSLEPRRVVAFDGNVDLFNTLDVLTLTDIEVDSIPTGDLTYYVLEGDVQGGTGEQVSVQGKPGGAALVLADAVNPLNNPFNQTINTTAPPQTGVVGVDIDRYDITAALAAMDTEVELTISAANDKVWLAASVMSVGLFDPAFSQNTTKSVALFVDDNGDGLANPGDTLRYTIRMENDGNEAGTVNVVDPVPAEFISYSVTDAGGGMNVSTPDEVRIDGITVPPGGSADIVIDMVIDAVADGTLVSNTAMWSAPMQGGLGGSVTSIATEVHDPPVVEPDMGMPGDDMGTMPGDDMGPMPGDDMGTMPADDMGTLPTVDMGGAYDEAGSGPGVDSGNMQPDSGLPGGPAATGKDLSDSGCCATAANRQLDGAWLLLLALVALRRRRVAR